MILQEVLRKVEFADLVNTLIGIDSETKNYLYGLKQAFDLLRRMEPKPSDGKVVNVSREYHKYNNTPYLAVNYNERTDWDVMISYQVDVKEGDEISAIELAAILLLEITYMGFSPELEKENLERKFNETHEEGNPYVTPYKKLHQRHHDLNCRYPEDIGTEYFTLKGDPLDLFKWEPKRNGPKRHRERRQKKRIKFLESKMKCWDLHAKLIKRVRLEDDKAEMLRTQIMEGGSISHHILQSRTEIGNEISYIGELFRDYFPLVEAEKAIVLFHGPKRIIEDSNTDLNMLWKSMCASGKLPSTFEQVRSVNEDITDLCVDILVFEKDKECSRDKKKNL